MLRCRADGPRHHRQLVLDLQTKKEEYMDKAEMVLVPTIFERARDAGMNSALLTAKGKTQTLLRTGAKIRLAAEKPELAEGSEIDWVDRLGPPPEIYSAEINHWLFKATQIVLDETDCQVIYYHTTDYPMHMEPDKHQSRSLRVLHHMHKLELHRLFQLE